MKKPSVDTLAWQAAGLHCSANERRADEASRDVEAWLKCKYMREHLGEEFSGVVSSVTSFGLFVTLDAMYVEGLVHITELGGEYFRFDEARQELRGERTGIRYALGTKVNVQVSRVDLDGRRIDFRLVTGEDELLLRAMRDKTGGASKMAMACGDPSAGQIAPKTGGGGRGHVSAGQWRGRPGAGSQVGCEAGVLARKDRAAAIAPRAASPARTAVEQRTTMRVMLFLLDTVFFFLVAAALLRAWMNHLRVHMSAQPGRFAMAVTNWLVQPVRRILPRALTQSRFDWGSFMAAVLLALGYGGLWLGAACTG